ncbi:hypothetical protein TSAR_004447 [Trichomalopsis sarcophagae]|uniref:Uncharacterized protein n=1 Tax=Trichomalopsis sarcophagae TaxID=543379 RepID=A0A232EXL2_9HYME|nr:hypothetical protein TSAR_004447 [Trichomalopsis sarcophagae]
MKPGSKLAEAISKGTDAINKLVQTGEIEELRDVIGINEGQLDIEDYLQDEGEIDYSKVPKIDLPAPLASSKFAQNPELLKALNRGGKRKFDQLIGWSDVGATDKVSQIYQPIFNGVFAQNSQSNDNEFRFTLQEKMSENTTGPERPSIYVEHDLNRNFVENITPQNKCSISFVNAFGEKDVDDRLKWDKENSKIKSDDNFLHYTFDNHQEMKGNMHSCNNISHISNINPNMPPPCLSIIQNESQHSIKLDCNAGADNTLPHITSQQSDSTIFRSSGPPSGFGPGTFRPLHNSNFSPNLFKPMVPFHHQSSFNNFCGPLPNFRSTNSQFDRHQFGGQNYKFTT